MQIRQKKFLKLIKRNKKLRRNLEKKKCKKMCKNNISIFSETNVHLFHSSLTEAEEDNCELIVQVSCQVV